MVKKAARVAPTCARDERISQVRGRRGGRGIGKTHLRATVEVLEGHDAARAGELPLEDDESRDEDGEDDEARDDRPGRPGVLDAAPLQGEDEAGDDAEHEDGADPVEGERAEREGRARRRPPTEHPAHELALCPEGDVLAHRRRGLRAELCAERRVSLARGDLRR